MPTESSWGRIFQATAQLGPQVLLSKELTPPEEAKPRQLSYTPAGPSSILSPTLSLQREVPNSSGFQGHWASAAILAAGIQCQGQAFTSQ